MKLMFSCKDVHDRASLYIDNDMGLLARMGILMHLLICGQCRLFIKQLKLTVATVSRMKISTPESELAELAQKLQRIRKENLD